MTKRARHWASAGVRLGLGATLFAAVLWWIAPSWSEVSAKAQPRWEWLAVGLLGTALGTAAASARWKIIVEALGDSRLPYATYFHVFALNRVLAQFLPAVLVDLVGRGVTLRAAGGTDSVGRLSTLVVLERILDVVLPVWLLGWALVAIEAELGPFARWSILVAFAVTFALGASTLLRPTASLALRLYRRVRPGPTEDQAVPAVPRSVSQVVVGLTMGRYAALVLQFWGLGRGVGVDVPLEVVFSASTIAQLASIIAITPGGLGFAEGGWAAAMQWQNVDAVTTSLFVLASRVGMAAAFGILTAVTWRYGRRRPLEPDAS